jgi:phosphatidylethanolamine-binding protein (PEBP) family uncharacterized protein
MAPRSGAERLLSPKIRRASARFILALAAASTLAISGCGGSSSGDQTASAPASSQGAQTEAEDLASKSQSQSQSKSPSSSPKPSPVPNPNPVPGSESEASTNQGKQGPRVKIPSGKPESGITPQQRAEATVASIALESPTLGPSSSGGVVELPATYTCDGKDTWPELAWQGVPADTAELALFAMNLKPAEGKLIFDWTVAGLDPSLTGIPAGRLPKGAVVGRNSFGRSGYTICPPQGSGETYIFALYALPKRVTVQKGFDPIELRKEVGRMSGNGGVMAMGYQRG